MASPEDWEKKFRNEGFYKSLLLTAYSRVQSVEDSKDIVQSAIVELLKKSAEEILAIKDLEPYIHTVVRNKAYEWLRKKGGAGTNSIDKDMKEPPVSTDHLFLNIEAKEMREAFYVEFTEASDRIIFEMWFYEGYPHKIIAEAVQKPEGSVRKRVMEFRQWRKNNFRR